MPSVSKDQLARAREIDVLDYVLRHEAGNMRRIGSAYRMKDHPSLEVKPGRWRWYSQNLHGRTALDYLTDVRGYGLVEAVYMLLGDQRDAATRSAEPKAPPTLSPTTERKVFALPIRNADNNRVIEYLQSRGIDRQIILDCIANGSLYENATYHNCIFVGRDKNGKARFAAKRGTNGSFKCDAEGSDKRYGFTIPPTDPNSREIAVFESPIDCLSHQTLCKLGHIPAFDGWRLSLGGTSLVALERFLENHPTVKHCVVCTDNDAAGRRVAADIENNYTHITTARSPPTHGKDWNETLLSNEVKSMEDKRKDIRFITNNYKTLFTVKDGDNIKFTSGYDGEVKTLKCRHIDEAHIRLVGKYSDDFHICELAEKMERNGSKCEPIPGQKPMLNILAAKYGEPFHDLEIPMTKAAIVRLLGGTFTTEDVRGEHIMLRGKNGVAVCKSEDGALTSVHPYWAQTLKRELGVIEPPTPRKRSLHEKLDDAKSKVAGQKSVVPPADEIARRGTRQELG